MNVNKIAYRSISVKLQIATGSHDVSGIAGSHVIAVNRLTLVIASQRYYIHSVWLQVCYFGTSLPFAKSVNSDIHTTHRAIASNLSYIYIALFTVRNVVSLLYLTTIICHFLSARL